MYNSTKASAIYHNGCVSRRKKCSKIEQHHYGKHSCKKYQGKYLDDIKDGIWKYYKDNKSFDYQLKYINGISQGRQDG